MDIFVRNTWLIYDCTGYYKHFNNIKYMPHEQIYPYRYVWTKITDVREFVYNEWTAKNGEVMPWITVLFGDKKQIFNDALTYKCAPWYDGKVFIEKDTDLKKVVMQMNNKILEEQINKLD